MFGVMHCCIYQVPGMLHTMLRFELWRRKYVELNYRRDGWRELVRGATCPHALDVFYVTAHLFASIHSPGSCTCTYTCAIVSFASVVLFSLRCCCGRRRFFFSYHLGFFVFFFNLPGRVVSSPVQRHGVLAHHVREQQHGRSACGWSARIGRVGDRRGNVCRFFAGAAAGHVRVHVGDLRLLQVRGGVKRSVW